MKHAGLGSLQPLMNSRKVDAFAAGVMEGFVHVWGPRPSFALLTIICVCLGTGSLFSQQPPVTPPKPAPTKPATQNPFETVPQATEPAKPETAPAKPGAPQLESPKPAAETPTPTGKVDDVVELVEFRGARRVPQDTLRSMIQTRKGDRIDEEGLRRDFMTLWNSGRFDDISLEREEGRTGYILRFVVVERRIVRSIKYDGAKSVTVSEILDRFKERRVGLTVESQYDPNKVQRAAVVLKEYLAERGRQYAT